MRSFITILLTIVMLLAPGAYGPVAQAQTVIPNPTNTTLSAAISSSGTDTVYLTSTTGVLAASGSVINSLLLIGQEIMAVQSINGSQVRVTRGYRGSLASPYPTGGFVIVVSPTQTYDNLLRGACTAPNQPMLPRIVLVAGGAAGLAIKYQTCSAGIWIDQATFGDVTTNTTQYSTVPIGSVAYGSMGTSTSFVAGTTFYSSLFIPQTGKFTGVKVLQNGTVGTDKVIAILYDASGNVLATSAIAGTTTSGANTFLTLPFTTAYIATGPAKYFIGIQGNGVTDGIRTQAASTFIGTLASSATGTFATIPAITAPTTFTADKGPIASVYF